MVHQGEGGKVDSVHVIRMDVAASEAAGFDRWYRDQFLPRVIGGGPWARADVYTCTTGSPEFLVLIRGRVDPASAAGVGVPPFPFEDEYGPAAIRNYEGESFALVQEAGRPEPRQELINLITTDVRPSHAVGFDRWYRDRHVPDILGCPGWIWVQRFHSLDCDGKFLAVYGISSEELAFSSGEYRAAVGWQEHVNSLLGFHGFRIYKWRYGVEDVEPSGDCRA